MKKVIVLLTSVLTISIATEKVLAGGDGNGGYGQDCGKNIELLDLYEARERYGYTLDRSLVGPNELETARRILKRAEIFMSPKLLNEYLLRIDKFYQTEAGFLGDKEIVSNGDIILNDQVIKSLDIGTAMVKRGCRLKPMARNLETNGKRIFIYDNNFARADEFSKGALIVHELLYTYQNWHHKAKEQNSERIRWVVGFLASNEIVRLPLYEVYKELRKMKVDHFNFNGELVKEEYAGEYIKWANTDDADPSNDYIRSYTKDAETKFDYMTISQGNEYYYKPILIGDKGLKLTPAVSSAYFSTELKTLFFPNGKIEGVIISSRSEYPPKFEVRTSQSDDIIARASGMRFNENGDILEILNLEIKNIAEVKKLLPQLPREDIKEYVNINYEEQTYVGYLPNVEVPGIKGNKLMDDVGRMSDKLWRQERNSLSRGTYYFLVKYSMNGLPICVSNRDKSGRLNATPYYNISFSYDSAGQLSDPKSSCAWDLARVSKTPGWK